MQRQRPDLCSCRALFFREKKMGRDLEFDWTAAELVVQPVQAVVVYPAQNGVVIRQQKALDRDRDEVINVPHHALYRLILRLQELQNSDFIDADEIESAELVEILAAE